MSRPSGYYAWLNDEPGPRMLLEALKLYGVLEAAGPGNNPTILAWADEVGDKAGTAYAKWAAGWYAADSTAWCGLFMAVVAVRANVESRPERMPPEKYLSALEWTRFGVGMNHKDAMLGDVLVFSRSGGGHVALYVGEDATAYHVLGGNQGDTVSLTRILKARCVAVRRPPYLNRPPNVRRVWLAPNGAISRNEA
jgi:uncharacterized protein (TIGR02594 family)